MKKYSKILSVFTIACLLTTSLYGCKSPETKESESVLTQSESIQNEETEEETLDMDESGEDVLVEIPSEVDAMRPILKGLCKVMSRGASFDSEDDAFYWNALYSSINGSTWVHPDVRLSDTGAGYLVPVSVMKEYASAMFAGAETLPEIPNTTGGIEYIEEEDGYLLYSAGGITGNMDIMAVEETENGYSVSIAFYPKKDTVKNYTFELQNDADAVGSFPCQVYSVE